MLASIGNADRAHVAACQGSLHAPFRVFNKFESSLEYRWSALQSQDLLVVGGKQNYLNMSCTANSFCFVWEIF